MPLDNFTDDDDDDDEAFQHALEVAKAALKMISLALEDEAQLIAVLGAMTELALKHVDGPAERKRMTTLFMTTLREHMAQPS